jgi:hypothetical protein
MKSPPPVRLVLLRLGRLTDRSPSGAIRLGGWTCLVDYRWQSRIVIRVAHATVTKPAASRRSTLFQARIGAFDAPVVSDLAPRVVYIPVGALERYNHRTCSQHDYRFPHETLPAACNRKANTKAYDSRKVQLKAYHRKAVGGSPTIPIPTIPIPTIPIGGGEARLMTALHVVEGVPGTRHVKKLPPAR